MVAEERYPECGGRVDDRLTSRRTRAMPALAARPDTPLLLRTATNAFEPGSPGAYAPNGRQKCRK